MMWFRPRWPTVGPFLDWWIGELASFLPARWRSGGLAATTLSLAWRSGSIELWRQDRTGRPVERLVRGEPGAEGLRAELLAAGCTPDGRGMTLHLPEARVLRRSLVLPRAAEPFLQAVLGNELAQRTPWRPEQVHFATIIESREPTEITVGVTVLPKAAAEPALADLAALGLRPARLALGDSGTVSLFAERRSPMLTADRRTAIVVIALLVAGALSLLVRQVERMVLERKITTLAVESSATMRVADEVARLNERLAYPIARKLAHVPAVVVLEDLSRLLPDDSWVNALRYDGETVQIDGLSADATRLLSLIDGSRHYQAAHFSAALVRDERGGDRFHIAAQAVPHVEP